MATEEGIDWRVFVGDGQQSEHFDKIGGELSFDWSRSSTENDESTKDDGDYGASSFGQQKVSIKVNGNVKLPDAGLQRASVVSKTKPRTAMIRIMRGDIVKFECLMSLGNFNCSFPKDGPATYSFDAVNKGAPSVDALGAVS